MPGTPCVDKRMKRRVSATGLVCAAFFIAIFTLQLFLSFLPTRPPPSDLSYHREEARCNVGVQNSSFMVSSNSEFSKESFHGNENVAQSETPPITPLLRRKPAIACDRDHYRYDLCLLDGPTIMHPSNSTFAVMDMAQQKAQKIRPYPRKWEPNVMDMIKEVTLSVTKPEEFRQCQVWHDAPAIVFSTGGYTGNFYHEFTDGFVPLFVTVQTLFGGGQDPVLVIANCHNWWLTRYDELLHGFTSHPVINLDNQTAVHCFRSVAVGLIAHGDMSINPTLMPNSESFREFHAFVHRSYQGKVIPPPTHGDRTRPRLVLVARTGSVGRVILNQAQVVKVAQEVGFNVDIFEPTPFSLLRSAYGLINGSHALVGVHGAALTHMFFLRPGAVFIQVVPLGLEWASDTCFGGAAPQIGLDYMEYKISVEESSLVETFEKDDVVLRNPRSVVKKGWNYTTLYLKEQDVRLDLGRFRNHLKLAYKKARRLMTKEKVG